ncbi:MAG TPA: RDD family protein [Vicinamibacterales bacterium]
MKCPKCDYLGFETGDRCRNCGYDFSLLSVVDPAPPDYEIHPAAVDDVPVHLIDEMLDTRVESRSHDTVDTGAADALALAIRLTPEPPSTVAETPANESGLPLFTPAAQDDDEPLIKLPAAPRPPLAVRRTPEPPRLRPVPRSASRPAPALVLQFSEEVAPEAVERVPSGTVTEQAGRPGARLIAMLIDYVILLGIDAAVVYFTVRMAGLTMNEWRLLPVTPMLTFLGLLKVAYFYAFTAVGGQTIGKMAVGTCVVGEDGHPVDAALAMRRTSAGIVSFLLLGLGFLPALFGDHRALHDRLAGTRVVRLRSI